MKWIIVKRGQDLFQLYYHDETDKPTLDEGCVIIAEGEDVETEIIDGQENT